MHELSFDGQTLIMCYLGLVHAYFYEGSSTDYLILEEQLERKYSQKTWVVVFIQLTYLPLVSHICVSEWGQHWFR